MPFQPNQPLWYAWLSVKKGAPPIAQILEVFWLRPDKAPDTSRVSTPTNKFGLVAANANLHADPTAARADLIQQIQTQAAEQDYIQKMLWAALAELDENAIIDWPKPSPAAPPVKIVGTGEEAATAKTAIVNPITRLKQEIVAQANRNRRQASLIANAQRRTRK